MSRHIFYIVDCENVGLKHLKDSYGNDETVIYMTSRCVNGFQPMNHEELEIYGHDGSKNALDFIVATKVGYIFGSYDITATVYIISKDLGFENIIGYWRSRGYDICRRVVEQESCTASIEQPKVEEFTKDKILNVLVSLPARKSRAVKNLGINGAPISMYKQCLKGYLKASEINKFYEVWRSSYADFI